MGDGLETADVQLRIELDQLERKLFGANDEIESLRDQLAVFERGYLRRVGPVLVQLFDLHARWAELKADRDPEDHGAAAEAERQREQADNLEQEAAAVEEETQNDAEPEAPTMPLRDLRRKAARLFHPDLASDDADRERREHFMKEANNAFADRDADRLEAVINDWLREAEPSSPISLNEAVEMMKSKIATTKAAIEGSRRALGELQQTDLNALMRNCENADAEGRDLMVEMIDEIRAEITDLRWLIKEMETT